jgi:dethiobiotin synthase
MSLGYFITGTDTNVGKTVVSAWLVHHLNADYWKPIQSGSEVGLDRHSIQDLVDLDDQRIHEEVYILKAFLSPHAAAKREQVNINLNHIVLPTSPRPLIVEGAGGVMVPLNDTQTMLDLMEKLALPVIIVARSGLGTLNHTCLTIAALRQRAIPLAGVILNGPQNEENKHSIVHYGKVPVLAELDWISPLTRKTLQMIPLQRDWLPNCF